jgi:uncharacterized membrane protein
MDLFKALFKYPLETFNEGRLVFLGRIPGELLVLLGLAAAVVVWLLYRRVSGKLSKGPHRALLVLRVLAIALVLALLGVPALSLTKPRKNMIFTAVMVDTSRSMSIPDAGGRTRIDAARALLEGDNGLLRRLSDSSTVVLFEFSRGAQRAPAAGALKADGRLTNLFLSSSHVDEELRGLSVASVVMLTDGCRNDGGNSEDAARMFKARGVPMHIVGIGNPNPPLDYEVAQVFAPQRFRRNSEVELSVHVRHTGYDKPFELQVSRDKTVLHTQVVTPREGADMQTVRFAFTPDFEGAATYTVSIPEAADESLKQNNSKQFNMAIHDERLPVLYVEGSPRLEYRFLRRSLYRDQDFRLVGLLRLSNEKPSDVAAAPASTTRPAGKLHFYVQGQNVEEAYLDRGFPTTKEQLYKFEAIILGDIEAGFFTPEQLAMLEEFVRVRGGGLLMLGGVNSFGLGKYAGTPVGRMLPVAVSDKDGAYSDETFKARVAAGALDDLLMRLANDPERNKQLWENAPPLIGLTPVSGLKVGAKSLLTTEKGEPVLASIQYGQGRVAAFTSGGSWYWQMSVPAADEFHEKFWKQMVRWLVVGAKERLAVEPSAPVYDRGETATLRATVLGKDLTPVNNATVLATVTDPLGNAQELRMDWVLSEDGVYQARYQPAEEGLYLVKVRVDDEGWKDVKPADGDFRVSEPVEEFTNAGLKEDLLRSMAAISGGKYYTVDEADGLAQNVASAVKVARDAGEERINYPLWDMPAFFGVILVMMGAEWFVRRRSGLA